ARTVAGVHPLTPKQVSRTKTSSKPLVSFGTRLLANDTKLTKRPSALIVASRELSLACVPSVATDTSFVEGVQPAAPTHVSRTKMFCKLLVPPGTRLVAAEVKATKRPSALIEGSREKSFACVPSPATDTSLVEGVQPVAPAQVSRTKTSGRLFVSLGTKLVAPDKNATERPLALIQESVLNP